MNLRLTSVLMFTIVVVSGLCWRHSQAQSLVDEQVCNVGDDLIRETELGQVNITENLGGLYIMTSNPAPCEGVVSSIEVCVSLRNLTIPSDGRYRILGYFYRYDETKHFYDRVVDRIRITFTVSDNTTEFYCHDESVSLSLNNIVQKGDFLAIFVNDECFDRNSSSLCPAQPIINPAQTTPTSSVLYYTQAGTRLAGLTLTPTPVRVNAKASFLLTPPDLPAHCTTLATPTNPPSQAVSDISIGVVDENPNSERRFWGGGIYILPEKMKSNGTATSFSYCGLLNTEGKTDVYNFRFQLGQMRETEDMYVLIRDREITLENARPAVYEGFNDTIHCELNELIPDGGWEVHEGDLFAVYIFNKCDDKFCPVQLNLLNLESCESTLHRQYNSREKLRDIPKNDTLLREVPIHANIKISVTATSIEAPLSTLTTLTPSATTSVRTLTPSATPPSIMNVRLEQIRIGLSAATVLLLLTTFSTILLVVIVIAIKWRQKKKNKILDLSVKNELAVQEIALSSNVNVSINERGIIRRTTITNSLLPSPYERPRPRLLSKFNDYSIILPRTESQTETSHPSSPNHAPLLPIYEGAQVHNGTLLPNYEVDDGDYAAPVFSPADMEEELKQQLVTLGIDEIPENQLEFEEELGHGQFGTVYKALWHVTVNQDTSNPQTLAAGVAVKVMDNEMTSEDRIKFLQEAVLMGQFSDPNIVAIFGVVTMSSKLMLLCELMDDDLRKHLTSIRTNIQNGTEAGIDSTELPALLLSYCRKIASSFVYLGLKTFVHRDLAARNILVSNEGDCKIADFGMSRELQDDSYYKSHGGMVPVKWTPPEAILYKKYSTKSDVWSYGILLYEIWSLGQKPYQGMTNTEVIAKVQTGYRLPPPPGCPRTIYDIMIKCTHPEQKSRPTFTNVLVDLQRPDYQLLKWTQDDVATSSEAARTLGAPLDEGHCLYKNLQNTYMVLVTESSM